MIGDPFTMVVAIVAIAVGAGVIKNYQQLKANKEGDADVIRGLDALRADVARLSDRVAALEKIATDPEKRLASEIDRLR